MSVSIIANVNLNFKKKKVKSRSPKEQLLNAFETVAKKVGPSPRNSVAIDLLGK